MFWSAAERFPVQGIRFVLTLVIAHIPLPNAYGLVVMLGVFMALSQVLVDSGFANVLIQKKNRMETDYSTVFYFNAAGSSLIYLCLLVCTPLIVRSFAEPQLTVIARVIGLTLVINSLGIVQQARLTVDLGFKRLAQVSLGVVAISGAVGIWLAYHGFGVWILAQQSLLNSLLRVVPLWISSRWMPRRIFSWQSFRVLFFFGPKLTLANLLHTLYVNCCSLITGKCFLASQLGFFNRSYILAQFSSINFMNIAVRAAYPTQCRYQDDMPRLRSMFLKYARMSYYLIFPVTVAVAALVEPLAEVVSTDKWPPAAPHLQALCIAFMWDLVMKISHSVLNVKGRTDYLLCAEIWKKLIAFAILLATIPLGVSAVCWGLMLYPFADMGVIICYSRKLMKVGYLRQLCGLLPVLLLNGVMGMCLYPITPLPLFTWGQFLLGVPSGLIIYVMGSCVFRMSERQMLLSVLNKSGGRSSLSSEQCIFLFSFLPLFFSYIEAWILFGLLF